MKNKHSIASFLSGVFVTLLLIGTILPAGAVSSGKNVTVYPGVNIYVDDYKLDPKDVNGNPVEVFIYNGSTYLPVRAVSEALGKPVQWDGSTSSVYIGKHSSDKPAAWLSDMDYYDVSSSYDWQFGQEIVDNLGNSHPHCLDDSGFYHENQYVSYKINKQYSLLTGIFFQKYNNRNEQGLSKLAIYGDDQLLWSGSTGKGENPVDFSIDIYGVETLKIVIDSETIYNNQYARVALGEVGLWT